MFKFIDGYKTYITAVLIAAGAGVMALGYDIPEWIWPVLGAFGLGSVKSAIKKTEKK